MGPSFQAQQAQLIQGVNANNVTQTNQSVQQSIAEQQALLNQINAQNGLGNQSQVFSTLGGIANGTGPNPASAQLNQQTGQNIANQAALMAGQRGANANTGLIARQAAQQGAATQQQAVGQGATLQANQALNAIGQQSGIANAQAGQALQGQQQLNQASLAGQQNILGAIGQLNTANVSNVASQNQANEAMAQSNTGILSKLIGGIGGAVGLHAEGGMIKSPLGQALLKYAQGGKVPALVSPGEHYLSPAAVKQVTSGTISPMKAGQEIPGKPKVSGAKNSYANDTVKKNLDEGGIILPRSVTKSKNPDKAAKDFVAAILARG